MSRYQLGLPGIITGLACMFSGGRVVLSVCITTFRPECPKCGDNPAPSLVRYLNRIEMNVRHFLRCVNILNVINVLKNIVAVMALNSYLCRNSDAVLGRIAFV